jgi:hypothetical protein
MSRVERLEASDASRRPQEPRETRPNPRKMGRTPDQAEGDEPTVDAALESQDREKR